MTGGEAWRQRACGTILVVTSNIRDGLNTGLYAAARALKMLNADVAILQETKFTNTNFATRKWAGYNVLAAAAGSNNCEGIALLVKANEQNNLWRPGKSWLGTMATYSA